MESGIERSSFGENSNGERRGIRSKLSRYEMDAIKRLKGHRVHTYPFPGNFLPSRTKAKWNNFSQDDLFAGTIKHARPMKIKEKGSIGVETRFPSLSLSFSRVRFFISYLSPSMNGTALERRPSKSEDEWVIPCIGPQNREVLEDIERHQREFHLVLCMAVCIVHLCSTRGAFNGGRVAYR